MKNRCYSLRNVLAIAFLCVAMLWTASASAEDKFPSKQLTYVVTFDPGGQSDREAVASRNTCTRSWASRSLSTTW